MADVAPEHFFHVHDGKVLKNLEELEKELRSMKSSTWKHHVTKDRNDFENWVLHVFNDRTLSRKLGKTKNHKAAAKLVKAHLKSLAPKAGTKVVQRTVKAKKVEVARKKAPAQATVRRLTPRNLPSSAKMPDAHHFVEQLMRKEAMEAPRTDASHFLRSAAVDFGLGLLVGILLGIIIAKTF